MANTKSAKKRAHQAVFKKQHNMIFRSKVRTAIKKVDTAISENKVEDAEALFKITQSEGQKAARKNLFAPNKISRDISRLNSRLKKIAKTTTTG